MLTLKIAINLTLTAVKQGSIAGKLIESKLADVSLSFEQATFLPVNSGRLKISY
ncbi:hypothetical protein [Spirosoma luteum]|uniref:hypothetical protein n=1 Tax=Spirosoma luteum TaxID=431553 RepID=UPI000369F087|nr:hypothetical protein [Spirosoma luteum]